MLRREKDLDKLIYDGRHTANLILNDVRIGDIYDIQTDWDVPVHENLFRLIWPKARHLNQKCHNTDMALTQSDQGEYTVFSLVHNDVKSVRHNTQTPRWFRRCGYILLSETEDWASVVAWALPLYQPAYESNPRISILANQISQANGSEPENVIRALNYLQNEIRYLGIEYGVNSHQPSPPQQTFERRYGDCKDKTVALISLLTHLGIQAYPALVNTNLQHRVCNLHPTIDAFDHVIVRADVNGRHYWLDPTRSYQGQSLDEVFQMDGAASQGDETVAQWLRKNIYYLIIVGWGLLLIYCLIEWLIELRKQDRVEGGYYYCVSLTKLLILNIATLNIFQIFWFYQNWEYIKQRDDAMIMPFWRAIFLSNSLYRPRHYILIGMAAIYLAFGIGSMLNWIPNGEVVKGHQLPSWDLKHAAPWTY